MYGNSDCELYRHPEFPHERHMISAKEPDGITEQVIMSKRLTIGPHSPTEPPKPQSLVAHAVDESGLRNAE